MRTRQLRPLPRLTYILHIIKYPLLHPNLDEPSQCRSHKLHQKRRSWWHLDVMPKLQVLHERSGFGESLDRVGFEDHVGERLAWEERAWDDLC